MGDSARLMDYRRIEALGQLMTLTIEISDELAAALRAKAEAEGLSPDSYVGRVLEKTLVETEPVVPFKNSYGILAKYGPAPSEEDIAEVRREMWANFPRDEPKP
jgi:hypothetical protein